jgi:hypothetical protein
MADELRFLRQTASFALREYFRPLVVVARFLKSRVAPAEPAEHAAEREEPKAVRNRFHL